jgi:hypothetical protein
VIGVKGEAGLCAEQPAAAARTPGLSLERLMRCGLTREDGDLGRPVLDFVFIMFACLM